MSGPVEFNAFTKGVAAFKDFPLWLLLGLGFTFSVAAYVPVVAGAPEAISPWLRFGGFLFLILATCRFGSLMLQSYQAKRERNVRLSRRRLQSLYRPMFMLFLTRQITVVESVGAPRLYDRLSRALSLASSSSPSKRRKAFKALFDKRKSIFAEIEYGGDFPLSKIIEFVRLRSDLADIELLTLIKKADLAIYEEQVSGLITSAELALWRHIVDEHDRLVRSVGH